MTGDNLLLSLSALSVSEWLRDFLVLIRLFLSISQPQLVIITELDSDERRGLIKEPHVYVIFPNHPLESEHVTFPPPILSCWISTI